MAKLTKQETLKDNRKQLLLVSRIVCMALIVAWMFVIYQFSSDNGSESLNLSGGVTELFTKVVRILTGKDLKMSVSPDNYAFIELCLRKLAHMFIFFILSISTMLFLFTFKINMGLRMGIALLFSFVYACVDEYHQSFVSGRTSSFTDTLIDTGGAVLGILTALIIFCIIFTIYHSYQLKKIERYNKTIKA